MTTIIPSLKTFFLSAALTFMVLFTSGCVPDPLPLETHSGNLHVFRVIEAAPPATHAGSLFQTMRFSAYDERLGEIYVGVATWASFALTEPKPLFSDLQRLSIAKVLAREIPQLKPTERLLFRFPDQYKNLPIALEIYPDGETLVYLFRKLISYEDRNRPQADSVNMAKIAPKGRQSWKYIGSSVELRQPLGTPIAGALGDLPNLPDLQKILAQAIKAGYVNQEETPGLLNQLAKQPQDAPERLSVYLKKRSVLHQALSEKLLSQEEYTARLAKLNKTL